MTEISFASMADGGGTASSRARLPLVANTSYVFAVRVGGNGGPQNNAVAFCHGLVTIAREQ